MTRDESAAQLRRRCRAGRRRGQGPWQTAGSLGGSQSAVVRLRTPVADYVLKHAMPGPMALAEAKGLKLLAETAAVRVPTVLAVGAEPPYVLMEHVGGGRRYDGAELGRSLAALHRTTGRQLRSRPR